MQTAATDRLTRLALQGGDVNALVAVFAAAQAAALSLLYMVN